MLSPSLFSLHDEGSGVEKAMSLPNLFAMAEKNKTEIESKDNISPLKHNDKDDLLNLITEVTGLTDVMDDAMVRNVDYFTII